MTAPDVASLFEEARSYLVAVGELEEGDALPLDELVAQGEAVGYAAREVREALRETDAVVAGDDALETVRGVTQGRTDRRITPRRPVEEPVLPRPTPRVRPGRRRSRTRRLTSRVRYFTRRASPTETCG